MCNEVYGNDRGSFWWIHKLFSDRSWKSGIEWRLRTYRAGRRHRQGWGFVIFVSETKVGDKATISIDRVMRRFAIAHKV